MIMEKGIMARDVAEGGLYCEWWLSGLVAVVLTKAVHLTQLSSMDDHLQPHSCVCDMSEPRTGACGTFDQAFWFSTQSINTAQLPEQARAWRWSRPAEQ